MKLPCPQKRISTIKTKNPIIDWIISSLVVLAALFVLIVPLSYIFFPKKNLEVELYKKVLQEKVDVLTKEKSRLNLDYENGNISAEYYIAADRDITELLAEQVHENQIRIKRKTNMERVFDWKTNRVFMIGLGVRLPYLIFTLIIYFLVGAFSAESTRLNRALRFLVICCFTISFYELIWVFWPSQDYPIQTYMWRILIMCLISSMVMIKLLSWCNRNRKIV